MNIKKVSAFIICLTMGIAMCGCGGGSSSGGGSGARTTQRDYYDTNDARNTDRHYDNGEYEEGLKKAREVWDNK